MDESNKVIGIYSLFIGKYTTYYKNFIENINKNFLPNHKKIFYIVTDTDLPKYNDNTVFFKTEYIGWPYETLYRFKYFLKFENVEADIIYFLNPNTYLPNPITDVLPDETNYVFTIHDEFNKLPYEKLPYEKLPFGKVIYMKNLYTKNFHMIKTQFQPLV